MSGIVWVAKGEKAHVWYAYAEGRRFTLLFEEDVMRGARRWRLVMPGTTGTVDISTLSRNDVRYAQIAAEEKIEAFLRKGAVA